jgi:transposase
MAQQDFGTLRHIWADMAYRDRAFREWFERQGGWTLDIVQRPPKWGWYADGVEPAPVPSFTVLPRRWVVERSLGWLGRYRRLSKDYEFLPESSEAMIYLAMSRLMLRRLAQRTPHGLSNQHRNTSSIVKSAS